MSGTLHETVRQELLRRINTKHYADGQRLPSAAALAREFGVSAITIKRAIRDLQTAGVLRSVQGLANFVHTPLRFIRDLEFSFSSLEDADRRGQELTIELLSVGREQITDPGLTFFDPPNRRMLCLRKIISIDGAPVMHDTTYVSFPLHDDVIAEFADKLVSDVLRGHGMEFTATKLLIDAALASKAAENAFAIPSGYPTFRRLYRLATADPERWVLGIAESPFDRLACTIELKPQNRHFGQRS
jgi:DNA-binding GntR family transcriptional regulator